MALAAIKSFFKNLFGQKKVAQVSLSDVPASEKEKVHFLLPETAEEYRVLIQQEKEKILAEQKKQREFDLQALEAYKSSFEDDSQTERTLKEEIAGEKNPAKKELLERQLSRVVSQKELFLPQIKKIEEEMKNQPPAMVDKKKIAEIEERLRKKEIDKILAEGKVVETSFSSGDERRLVALHDRFFIIGLTHQPIKL